VGKFPIRGTPHDGSAANQLTTLALLREKETMKNQDSDSDEFIRVPLPRIHDERQFLTRMSCESREPEIAGPGNVAGDLVR